MGIPYEPKELAGIITLLRAHRPQRYLAIEGQTSGGWKYIGQACAIPHVRPIDGIDTRKQLREKDLPYDLISLDLRGMGITWDDAWKFLLGGKEQVREFGRGAPLDYGSRKVRPGTLIIFNLATDDARAAYLKARTMDNKMHQSTFAGMIKWT